MDNQRKEAPPSAARLTWGFCLEVVNPAVRINIEVRRPCVSRIVDFHESRHQDARCWNRSRLTPDLDAIDKEDRVRPVELNLVFMLVGRIHADATRVDRLASRACLGDTLPCKVTRLGRKSKADEVLVRRVIIFERCRNIGRGQWVSQSTPDSDIGRCRQTEIEFDRFKTTEP